MQKIYVVYYDNGQTYEDHHISVSKIFASRENAEKYAEERNVSIKEFKCSMTEEEYNSQDAEDIQYTYEDFYEMEYYDWTMFSESRFYVSENILHP